MDELNKIAPKLAKLKKVNPFGTPDKYFDDFSARLQVRLNEEKATVPGRKRGVIRLLKPALGLAASFALIILLVQWPLKTFIRNEVADNNTQTGFYDTDISTIFVDEIDESSFFALLNEPTRPVAFTDEDLISYLSSNVSEYEIYSQTNKFK